MRPQRVVSLVSAGAIVFLLAAALPDAALPGRANSSVAALGALDSALLTQLNDLRRANGLLPLAESQELAAAATQHTAEMLTDGFLGHNSQNGTAFWKRISRYYPRDHATAWSVGENLLSAGAEIDAQDALALWMASPAHRRNILAPGWRDVGVAAFSTTDGAGSFDGQAVTVITIDFGSRRLKTYESNVRPFTHHPGEEFVWGHGGVR